MTDNTFNWENFYQNVSGREPRELLLDVLKRFGSISPDHPLQAIDLGCGDGTETAALLANGWQVMAIDREPAAFAHHQPEPATP